MENAVKRTKEKYNTNTGKILTLVPQGGGKRRGTERGGGTAINRKHCQILNNGKAALIKNVRNTLFRVKKSVWKI